MRRTTIPDELFFPLEKDEIKNLCVGQRLKVRTNFHFDSRPWHSFGKFVVVEDLPKGSEWSESIRVTPSLESPEVARLHYTHLAVSAEDLTSMRFKTIVLELNEYIRTNSSLEVL